MQSFISLKRGFVFIAIVIILLFYVVYSTDKTNYLDKTSDEAVTTGHEVEYLNCPTESSFANVWNNWSYSYINNYPDNSVDEQMEDWNTLMVQNNCGDEWFDPLADLIEQQASSGMPVYWEHDTN